ncbi:MAG TPA: hypothetical protein VFU88_18350 [Ktedonobacterales bacterium]|nr:hypothetical protein [Ktedonobacterales bacterium]
MMVNELALAEALSPHDASEEEHPGSQARTAAVAARLRWAERLLPDDPDASALLLDGLLREIAWLWHAQVDVPLPAFDVQPALIERHDPLFGWRLRLALRAPNVHARLAHCAALYELLRTRAATIDISDA